MTWRNLVERITSAKQQNEDARRQAEGARSKERLEEILDDYQVENDQTERYGTKEDGTPKKITMTELRMLRNIGITGFIGGPLGGVWAHTKLREVLGIESKATVESQSQERYPRPQGSTHAQHDGHQDAFRHAYMSALMSRAMGPEWAERFTDAHERIPGSSDAREAMDLYNNEVGLRIARENPDASDEELSDLIYQAVEDGEMVVIKGEGKDPSSLAWSDNRDPEEGVPLWKHKEDTNGAEEREDGPFTLPPGL